MNDYVRQVADVLKAARPTRRGHRRDRQGRRSGGEA